MAWTFFGSIERATTSGFDFLAIYVGPILVFTLARGLVAKVVRVVKF
jgi:Na+/proline symporter